MSLKKAHQKSERWREDWRKGVEARAHYYDVGTTEGVGWTRRAERRGDRARFWSGVLYDKLMNGISLRTFTLGQAAAVREVAGWLAF